MAEKFRLLDSMAQIYQHLKVQTQTQTPRRFGTPCPFHYRCYHQNKNCCHRFVPPLRQLLWCGSNPLLHNLLYRTKESKNIRDFLIAS